MGTVGRQECSPEDVGLDDLLAQNAGDCQHGPPGVHTLALCRPLQELWVTSQTKRVEPKVCRQLAIQVLGRRGACTTT